MTSPTLREALEAEARKMLAANADKHNYPRCAAAIRKGDDPYFTHVVIEAMLAFATPSHEAGRRAGLEEAIAKAVGGMPAFPGTTFGERWDDEKEEPREVTLNEFMENTYISDKWPDLLARASSAAATAIRNLAGDERIET